MPQPKGDANMAKKNAPVISVIDPPVNPFSTAKEIKEWLKRLDTMPESTQRDRLIRQATRWLELADDK